MPESSKEGLCIQSGQSVGSHPMDYCACALLGKVEQHFFVFPEADYAVPSNAKSNSQACKLRSVIYGMNGVDKAASPKFGIMNPGQALRHRDAQCL